MGGAILISAFVRHHSDNNRDTDSCYTHGAQITRLYFYGARHAHKGGQEDIGNEGTGENGGRGNEGVKKDAL